MKAVGEIMQEMGFNKNSTTSVQEAFLRHLIKASSGADVQICTTKKVRIRVTAQTQQLSFNLEDDRLLKTAI